MNILTVPNCLTLLRLGLLPVVLVLYRQGWHVAAGVTFAGSMLTDAVDGWLAGKLDQRSALGLYLDPVVDKIVILVLLYELALSGLIPFVVAHLFLARELVQNGVRAAAAVNGAVVGANWMGKTKAALQTILITAGLVLPALSSGWRHEAAGVVRTTFPACAWGLLALTWCCTAVFIRRNRQLLAL